MFLYYSYTFIYFVLSYTFCTCIYCSYIIMYFTFIYCHIITILFISCELLSHLSYCTFIYCTFQITFSFICFHICFHVLSYTILHIIYFLITFFVMPVNTKEVDTRLYVHGGTIIIVQDNDLYGRPKRGHYTLCCRLIP